MDGSGELGGLETMETLTELGDELTLGDIDGEWWGAGVGVRGAGGARGEEGVTAARAGARAPTFSSHTARHRAAPSHAGGTGARGRRGGPRPFRVLRASAPPGARLPQAARELLRGRLVSGSPARVAGLGGGGA